MRSAVSRTSSRVDNVANYLPAVPLADLSAIDIPDNRARDFDPARAQALADILKTTSLINPISLRPNGERFTLVTGRVRLEAFRINGEGSIPYRVSAASSDDEARLEEVMENLGRVDLNALDRCHHLYELKQVYQRLYPETRAGTAGALARHGNANEVFSFAADTAEKVGLSRRAIEIAVAIWKGLSVASRMRCSGTWLAEHQGNLKLLSAQTPPIQKNVLDLILAAQPGAGSIAEALIILENGRLPTHVEKKFDSLNKAITKLKDEELETVLAAHEQRIVDWLKRTGRI